MCVYKHMSKIAAPCITEVYFICWVYTSVAGYLCVGYMFKCVYECAQPHISVYVHDFLCGTCLCSGSLCICTHALV